MSKVDTIKIGGGAIYAKVSERLKVFRSENPRGKIETVPVMQENGMVLFKATILKDKQDEFSAEATGHALQTKSGTKDFEKLETIAVGRALALLGYGADGEIASSDEMEEFEAFKLGKYKEEIDAIETVDELRDYFKQNEGKGSIFNAYVTKRKAELQDS